MNERVFSGLSAGICWVLTMISALSGNYMAMIGWGVATLWSYLYIWKA